MKFKITLSWGRDERWKWDRQIWTTYVDMIIAYISTSFSTSFIFHLCLFVPFLFNPIPFLVFLFFNFYTSCCFSYLLLFPLLSNSTLFPFFLIYLNFFCCLSSSFIYSFSSIFKYIIINIFQFYSRPIFLFIDFLFLSLFWTPSQCGMDTSPYKTFLCTYAGYHYRYYETCHYWIYHAW